MFLTNKDQFNIVKVEKDLSVKKFWNCKVGKNLADCAV